MVFLSVTKKCPLKCEHCFEWDNLNQKEVIGPEDINHMIENLQSMGATNIAFTGGEPMLRVREMAESIRRYKSKSQFWILTSGFNFTAANAAELRSAGAHGVVVSIDHYDPLAHDQFRGTQGSFQDAITAVKHALDQGYPDSDFDVRDARERQPGIHRRVHGPGEKPRSRLRAMD